MEIHLNYLNMRTIKVRGVSDDGTLVYPDKQLFRGLSNGDILQRFSNVEQFTGLQDSKGKDIYEGDIIKIPLLESGKSYPQKVIFDNGGFMLDFNYNKSGFMFTKNNMEQSEIIGNIHEHPELL